MFIKVTAPECYGKTEYLYSEMGRAIAEQKKIFVITPEQSTAEYEREIVERFGNKSNECVEITNFSRLSNVVLRNYGSLARAYLSEGGKKIAYSLAINEILQSLKFIKKLPKNENISRIISDIEELKSCGIESDKLGELADNDELDDNMRKKLGDMALISADYKARIKDNYDDNTDEESFLADILRGYKFFKNSEVYVDSFWDFTYPQRMILEEIMLQCDKLFVSFVASPDNKILFTKGRNALFDLSKRANRKNIETKEIRLENNYGNKDISFFAENLLTRAKQKHKTDDIRLISCKSPIEEAEFCANEISKLVHGGAKWNEISVLSRSGENDNAISLVFQKHDIPCFFDRKMPILNSPIAKTLLSAVKIACGERSYETAVEFLESAYLPVGETEAFTLIKYVKTWHLGAKELLSAAEFEYSPNGYEKARENETSAELKTVNEAKEKIFSPILLLSMALEKGSAEEKTKDLIAFMKSFGIEENINKKINAMKQNEDFAGAAREIRLWNSVISALAELIKIGGKSEISKEYFPILLENALSGNEAGSVPPSQDSVQIGKAGFSRSKGIKYVFVTGVSAGKFPRAEAHKGILSNSERRELSKMGYDLGSGQSGMDEQINEYFLFYLAAVGAKEKLYISFSPNEESETNSISDSMSIICRRFLLCFPNNKLEFFDSRTAFPQTKEMAFRYLLSNIKSESENMKKLRDAFALSEDYSDRLNTAVSGMAFAEKERFLEKEKPYLGKDIGMTYSRIEKYAKCRYEFFAQYLLDLKPMEKAEIKFNTVGSFIHEILEKVLGEIYSRDNKSGGEECSECGENRRSIADIDDDELLEMNKRAVREYVADMPGFGESARNEFLIKNIEKSTYLLILNIKEELSRSEFVPILFEKSLSELCDGYKLLLNDGTNLNLYGYIDRVDYLKDGNFVRVVDYKTGEEHFDLNKVSALIGAQMLIYLFALESGGFMFGNEKISPDPAGVLYLNGTRKNQKAKSSFELDKKKENAKAPFSYDGLIINDPRILKAFDCGEESRLLSSIKTKIDAKAFRMLRNDVEENFKKLAEELKSGIINPNPIKLDAQKKEGECEYCKFRSLCKRKDIGFRSVADVKKRSEVKNGE